MKILMVCAEFAPWAKTGGLADAVAGLSDALSASGHDVRVLLPRYAHLEARGTRHTIGGLGGPFRITELEPEPVLEEASETGTIEAGEPVIYREPLDVPTSDEPPPGERRPTSRQ